MKQNLLQPALIGGLVMGVLSALPLVGPMGNICCCLWVICGGVVAAYVLQQGQQVPITPGDGALVGLLAGVVGAFVHTVVSIPINLLIGPFERQIAQRIIDMAGPLPPEFRGAWERYGSQRQAAAFLILSSIFSLIFWMFIGAIFSTVGGVIGAAIFKKQQPPPAPPGTIDVTPTPPTPM